MHGACGIPIVVYLNVGEDCIPRLILGKRPLWMSGVVILVDGLEMYATIVDGVPKSRKICRFVNHSIKMGLSSGDSGGGARQ